MFLKSCHRNFLAVVGIYILMNQICVVLCYALFKDFLVMRFIFHHKNSLSHMLSQELLSCDRNFIPATKNFIWLRHISSFGKKLFFWDEIPSAFKKCSKMRNFPPTFPVGFQYFLGRFIPPSRGISHSASTFIDKNWELHNWTPFIR